jgi:crotonobetainyl-CoA:carnitine CoA-transferase CaiB-like acyl-CoA transferase
VVQAEAGLMAITGPADGEPSKVGVALVDLMTGQNAVIAILAALRAREHSGLGQRIDVSLFDTQLQSLSNVASSVCFTGEDARRYGNAHASIVPYQSFHASDGDFVLAVASDKLWQQLCETLAQPQWLTDPQFCDNAARVQNRDVVRAALAELFSAQPVQYWLDAMANAGVPAARVNTVKQALEHPVAHDRDMRIAIDGIPLVGSPLKLSGTPVRYQRPPPTLGEHTNEVLAELGLDASALRSDGIVR